MPKTEKYLAPLLDPLRDLLAWFKHENISGLVIGGVAASVLGRPRFTRDVDAITLLDETQWEKLPCKSYRFEDATTPSGTIPV